MASATAGAICIYGEVHSTSCHPDCLMLGLNRVLKKFGNPNRSAVS